MLGAAFFLTLAFCILEFVGGKLSGSLALMADAVHMLADVGALGLAFFAGRMAAKRATPKMTYGFYRFEILSAIVNGGALLAIALFIVKEALERFRHIPPIQTSLMIPIAAAGLVLNFFIGLLLLGFKEESINLRGAFFHVVSDGLSSLGTVGAGVVIALTGRRWADPAASCVIAVLISASGWRLLKDAVGVLLEAVPEHINMQALESGILSVRGVVAIHDLHVWSITSGHESLSAHLEAEPGSVPDELLGRVNEILSRGFNIHHTTIQIETADPSKPCPVTHKKKSSKHFHS